MEKLGVRVPDDPEQQRPTFVPDIPPAMNSFHVNAHAHPSSPPERTAIVTYTMPDGVQLEFNGAAIAHKPGVGTVTFERNGRKFATGPALNELGFPYNVLGMLKETEVYTRREVRRAISMLQDIAGKQSSTMEDHDKLIRGSQEFLQHFEAHIPVLETYVSTGEIPAHEGNATSEPREEAAA